MEWQDHRHNQEEEDVSGWIRSPQEAEYHLSVEICLGADHPQIPETLMTQPQTFYCILVHGSLKQCIIIIHNNDLRFIVLRILHDNLILVLTKCGGMSS